MSIPDRPVYRKFKGGYPIHLGDKLSSEKETQTAPLLDVYNVVLHQHIGAPPELLVKKGDTVKKGQVLARANGFVSAPAHSPTSGKVKSIAQSTGPMGNMLESVEIESDGKDTWDDDLKPIENWQSVDPKILITRVGDAGIVGMGGASFPTIVKLTPPADKQIDTLILNGAECEPYLTADNRLMQEHPEKIIEGAMIAARILNVQNVIIGIERNKQDAIKIIREKSSQYNIKVASLPVRYPQGAEKQLIYSVTERKVPVGGLPMDVGCVVQNVGTCAAIFDAVVSGHPLIERITTVTGEPVVNPGNWLFRIGTPISKALELAGGVKYDPLKLIIGGPMMGLAQKSLDVTIQKNTSGILLLGKKRSSKYSSMACISCGACVEACPMNLMPGTLSRIVEAECFDYPELENISSCIECGTCAYVCPAHRPMVQHFKRAKLERKNISQ